MPQKHFDERLDELKQALLDMSHRVEKQVEAAVALAARQDGEEPEEIIRIDQEIDEMEVAIEETAIELLALHQPMAMDLRLIVTVLKINNDLERIGDHAVNIAEAVMQLRELPERPPVPPQMAEMSRFARAMLRDALDDFVQLDADRAETMGARDDRVDSLHDSLFRVMLTHMLDHNLSACIQVILISRNLERIGDHAVNIAEDVVYLVRGTTIRHRGGQDDGDSEPETAASAAGDGPPGAT